MPVSSRPVVYRLNFLYRLILALAVVMFGGILAYTIHLQSRPGEADWSFVLVAGLALLVYILFALTAWTVRYEFSGSGLVCRGLFSRKEIRWDQIRKAQVDKAGNLRLEGTGGTVLSMYTGMMDGAEQVADLLRESSGIIPVEETDWTNPGRDLVRYLPYLLGGGVTAALLFAVVGGLAVVVLRGCGVALAFGGLILLAQKAPDSERYRGMYVLVGSCLFGLVLGPLTDDMFNRNQGLLVTQMGAFLSGVLLGGSLVVWLFRKRILEQAEQSGHGGHGGQKEG